MSSRSPDQSFRRQRKIKNRAARPGFFMLDVLVAETVPLSDDDLRADFGAVIKIDDVLVHEPDAARRHRLADREPFRRAMQAVARIATLIEQIHGTRAERVL